MAGTCRHAPLEDNGRKFRNCILVFESVTPAPPRSCPLSRQAVINTYFLEHRAKLLDIAAYLDRLDRAPPSHDVDFRESAFRQALKILADDATDRARRILELFSDLSQDLPQSAAGTKGATGAVQLRERGES